MVLAVHALLIAFGIFVSGFTLSSIFGKIELPAEIHHHYDDSLIDEIVEKVVAELRGLRA